MAARPVRGVPPVPHNLATRRRNTADHTSSTVSHRAVVVKGHTLLPPGLDQGADGIDARRGHSRTRQPIPLLGYLGRRHAAVQGVELALPFLYGQKRILHSILKQLPVALLGVGLEVLCK